MPVNNRVFSIDIMRGLTIMLMLFINDLNMEVLPGWIRYADPDSDGMGMADWVFTGFLFIVGMTVPFDLTKRLSEGQSLSDISRHIMNRFICLIIIGVLMINIDRVNPELTGISKNLWALLMYAAVFLFWNDYHDKGNRIYSIAGYKLFAAGIFIFLVFRFNSGEPENNGSLITGWWGILGITGWGYLVAASVYILLRDSIINIAFVTALFLLINISAALNLLDFLNPAKPFLGVIIGGDVPLTVLSGLLGGLIIKRIQVSELKKVVPVLAGLGFFYLVSGFFLRNWFIISRIKGTPSWVMICSGVSFLLFTLIFWISDIKNKKSWATFIKPAAKNPFTTYLLPDILY